MPQILHTATTPNGHQYVVAEYTVNRACRWYDSRRLVLAETDGTPYRQTNGTNVVRMLNDIGFDDVRSNSVRWEYLGTIRRLSRRADELARRDDTPPGSMVVTPEALEAAARAAGGAA